MDALILAAGEGRRLGGGLPKCLREVGGKPLIEHQLEALSDAGVRSVTVVVGYAEREVRHAVGSRARFVSNPYFARTNSLYSFTLARTVMRGEILVMNGDVLLHPGIVRMLVPQRGSVLAFDSRAGNESEDMKVATRGDRLAEMRKDLPAERTEGENLGVLRLDRLASGRAFMAAEWLIARGRHREWLASAINLTGRRHRLRCIDVAGLPWIEIDFPDDLKRAEREVWPAIVARRGARLKVVPAASPSGLGQIPPPDMKLLEDVTAPPAALRSVG